VTPPNSPLPEDIPSLDDNFDRQVGIYVSSHRLKWPRSETGSSTAHCLNPILHWYLLTCRV
jgi:hypothetical protein